MSIAHIYQRTTIDQSRLRSLPQDILAIESTDLTQVLNQAAELVRAATGTRSVAVMLYDATLDALKVVGTAGNDKHTISMERSIDDGGAAADVYHTGNPHFARYSEASTHTDSVLILPLVVATERRGVVELVLQRPNLAKSNTIAELKSAIQAIGVVVRRTERIATLLQDAAQQARSNLIEELASTLNHDLRNLMAPISGRLDLIRRQATREGHEKYVRHAEEATNATRRMQTILQNLVDVARLEQGTLPLVVQDIVLADLVHRVVADMHNVVMTAQIDVDDDVHINGDVERVKQTLEYIISNAFRNSPDDHSVVITIARTMRDGASWATVAVRDQGLRIAPDVLSMIFTRWITGRGSNTFNLGLYLAYGVAKAHGGTLQVQSDEPVGTTWTLVLPVTE